MATHALTSELELMSIHLYQLHSELPLRYMHELHLDTCHVPRILWDEAWLNAGAVKRHLPSAPLHMITENKVSLSHLLPFGSD